MKVFKFALVLRLVSILSYETGFQIRYKLNTFTNLQNLKVKNSLSFSVSYIFAIIMIIIIIIIIIIIVIIIAIVIVIVIVIGLFTDTAAILN